MGLSEKSLQDYSEFRNWLLLERGVRQSTAKLQVTAIHSIHNFLQDLTYESFSDFLVSSQQRGMRNATLNNYLNCVHNYVRFLQEKGYQSDTRILTIKKLKEQAVIRATMSDDEIESFLNLPCKRKGEKEEANYYKWSLFYKCLAFTGARPNEIAKLTVDLVDFGRGVFIVPAENSKTNTERYIPIPPNIKEELEAYVKTCDSYLFTSRGGGTARFGVAIFSNTQWGYNFHDRCKRLGIKRKGLCPYSLRHSMITRLLEEDVSFPKVMKIAGHTQASTTLKYTHMTTKDIQQAILKHPLIRKATDPQVMLDAFKLVIRGFEFEKNQKFTFNMREGNGELSLNLRVR